VQKESMYTSSEGDKCCFKLIYQRTNAYYSHNSSFMAQQYYICVKKKVSPDTSTFSTRLPKLVWQKCCNVTFHWTWHWTL